MRKLSVFLFFVGFLVMAASPCDALYRYLTFDETVQKADVIFVGMVTDQVSRYGGNGKMIFTDVYFDFLEVIYRSEKSEPFAGSSIMLTFAGGTLGQKSLWVSDVPTFQTGSSYLVFTRMDGKTYDSPIIGGFQGLFTVITDEEQGHRYPLTYGRRGIREIRDGHVVTSPPVSKVKGALIEKLAETGTGAMIHNVAPKPAEGMDPQKIKATVSPMKSEMPAKLVTLDELVGVIQEKIRGKGGDK